MKYLYLLLFLWMIPSLHQAQELLQLDEDEEVFMIVEEMARFPGCEDLETKDEKQSCAQRKMLEYVYGNLKYPSNAIEKKIEGQVVINFVVDKEGLIRNIQVVRSIDPACDQECVRLINEMNNFEERWTPGKQRGVPVNLKITFPIKFKLER